MEKTFDDWRHTLLQSQWTTTQSTARVKLTQQAALMLYSCFCAGMTLCCSLCERKMLKETSWDSFEVHLLLGGCTHSFFNLSVSSVWSLSHKKSDKEQNNGLTYSIIALCLLSGNRDTQAPPLSTGKTDSELQRAIQLISRYLQQDEDKLINFFSP